MDRIGVRELRQHASRYLRRVRAGEVIEVTDRGTPVARLVPVPAGSHWEQLLATGQVLPPERAGNLADVEPAPAAAGERPASEILEELREDRL